MKLLFVHDHIFYSSSDGNIYSTGCLPQNIWQRYLYNFSNIEVIGRHGGEVQNASTSFALSSRPSVNFKFVPKISSPLAYISSKKTAWKKIFSCVQNSDAVVARLPSENGLMAVKAAILLKKTYSLEVVACVWDSLYNYGSIIAKIYAPLAYYRMRRTIYRADRVLYVTKHFLQKRYPYSSKATVVNASDIELPTLDTAVLQKRFVKTYTDKIIFGLIGNYKTKYKGIHTAIEALSLLKNDYDFEFRILGKGDASPYVNMAQKYGIADRVIFCGSLPNGNPVFEWLDQIDIYLQPSLTEGLPRSPIEAMSRGCLCVASTAGGIPELLDTEYLNKPGDAKGMAQTIKKLLQKGNVWKVISERNFNHVREYQSDILNKRRFSFYKELRNAMER